MFANRISSSTSCLIWLPETSPPSSARGLLRHHFQSCNTSIDLLQLAAIYHPGGPRRLIDRLNRAQAKAAGKAELTVERIVGELAPVCLSSCVPSSRFLPADSAAGRFWNLRTSPSVTSCTFFAANGRVSPACSR